MAAAEVAVRRAEADDADAVARLLYEFNTEFDEPTPDVDVLGTRLRELMPA